MATVARRSGAGHDDEDTGRPRRRAWGLCVAGIGVWLVLLVAVRVWAQFIPRRLPLGNVSPFIGLFRVLPVARWLLAIAVAVLLIAMLPVLTRRMRWLPLLLVSWGAAAAWAVSLAVTVGLPALVDPLNNVHEYLYTLPSIDNGVVTFLSTFVERLPNYAVHTRGHPPGPVLVLYALQQLGLPVVPAEAVLVIASGSSAVAAVAVTVRVVAGERVARSALPFLVLAPLALWVASTMDAFFLGVSAWGVALLALAAECTRWPAGALAFGGGLVLGFGLYLTYGLAPFGLLPLAVLLARRRWTLLVPSGLGVAAVVAAFTAAGFWWFAGVAATHAEWASGVGALRPYGYFLVANIAILGLLVGPATIAALPVLRDRRLWWIVGAAALVVLASDLSGFERGEVERIWLPFAVWLLPATAALPGRPRAWLVAQAAVAITFQCLIDSPW